MEILTNVLKKCALLVAPSYDIEFLVTRHRPFSIPALRRALLTCKGTLKCLELVYFRWNLHWSAGVADHIETFRDFQKLKTLKVGASSLFGTSPQVQHFWFEDKSATPTLPAALETLSISLPTPLPSKANDALIDIVRNKTTRSPRLRRLEIDDPFHHFDKSLLRHVGKPIGVDVVSIIPSRWE